MDLRRHCGPHYKLFFLCVLILVIFEYDSLTRTLRKYNLQLRRPYSEVFISPEYSIDELPEINIKTLVEQVDTINDELTNRAKEPKNLNQINSEFSGIYDDYDVETTEEESFNDTVDDSDTNEEDVGEVELQDSGHWNKTLIVLFTSWGYSEEKLDVHKTLLRLWASWSYSSVQPLVLTNDVNVSRMAVAANWSVLPVTKRINSCKGPPVLRDLFFDTMEKYDALFYGFANADIIFGNGLVQTLKFLRNKYSWSKKPLLIVGRRYNYDFKHSRDNITDPNQIQRLMRRGKLVIRSTDYFFTNAEFPWKQVPMVSIGRPFVVRAVIGFAIKNHYTIVDATRTIESVHLTTEDGIFASWNKPGVNCNKNLLIKGHHKLPLGAGHCECAKVETVYNRKGNILLRSRPPSRKLCGGLT